MANQQGRYQEMERYMTYVFLGDCAAFLLYLLFAGLGVIWLKVVLAILTILVSGLCIGYLYLTGELLKPRSRWMSVGFAAVVLCVLVSLICNYPSPKPVQKASPINPGAGASSSSSDASGPAAYSFGDHYTI